MGQKPIGDVDGLVAIGLGNSEVAGDRRHRCGCGVALKRDHRVETNAVGRVSARLAVAAVPEPLVVKDGDGAVSEFDVNDSIGG